MQQNSYFYWSAVKKFEHHACRFVCINCEVVISQLFPLLFYSKRISLSRFSARTCGGIDKLFPNLFCMSPLCVSIEYESFCLFKTTDVNNSSWILSFERLMDVKITLCFDFHLFFWEPSGRSFGATNFNIVIRVIRGR